jgi:hypothetical protein
VLRLGPEYVDDAPVDPFQLSRSGKMGKEVRCCIDIESHHTMTMTVLLPPSHITLCSIREQSHSLPASSVQDTIWWQIFPSPFNNITRSRRHFGVDFPIKLDTHYEATAQTGLCSDSICSRSHNRQQTWSTNTSQICHGSPLSLRLPVPIDKLTARNRPRQDFVLENLSQQRHRP